MNKRFFVALVLCIGNSIMLVASDPGQQNSEKEELSPCCLNMQRELSPSTYGINIDRPDHHGFTALQHAVVQADGRGILWLLDNGANVNRDNNARATSITLAVQNIEADNFSFKRRMLRQLLLHSPSLDSVKDPEREISPKEVLASLRDCYPPGSAQASADLLEACIAREKARRMKRVLTSVAHRIDHSLVGLAAASSKNLEHMEKESSCLSCTVSSQGAVGHFPR